MSNRNDENLCIYRDILKIFHTFFNQVAVTHGLPSPNDVEPHFVDKVTPQTLIGYVEKLIQQLQDVLKTSSVQQVRESSHEEKTKNSNRLIDPNLVQVRAEKAEIERRITAFIERKQQEVDENNKREFCNVFSIDDEPENSCARTDAMFVAGSEGKSHVKVSRVVNSWGPQTRPHSNFAHLDKPPTGAEASVTAGAINARLQNMETHLGMRVRQGGVNNTQVFQRIKELEERILYLESLSPEYFSSIPAPKKIKHEAPARPSGPQDGTSHIYRGLSMSEINERITSLQHSLRQKSAD